MNPVSALFRSVVLKRHASTVKTCFTPLSKMKKAAVVVSATTPDAQKCVDSINAYYKTNGIEVSVYAINSEKTPVTLTGAKVLSRRDLNLIGMPKKRRVDLDVDMYVNLVELPCFAADYFAKCSRAVFKAGRSQMSGDVYDLVIVKSEGYSQSEVFGQMCAVFDKIK